MSEFPFIQFFLLILYPAWEVDIQLIEYGNKCKCKESKKS